MYRSKRPVTPPLYRNGNAGDYQVRLSCSCTKNHAGSHSFDSAMDRGSKGHTGGGVGGTSVSCPQHKRHNESTAKQKQAMLLHAMIATLTTVVITELAMTTVSSLAQVPLAFVTSVPTSASTTSIGSPDVTRS